MIINANLNLNQSSSFWRKDFQMINKHLFRKNSPVPIEAPFID